MSPPLTVYLDLTVTSNTHTTVVGVSAGSFAFIVQRLDVKLTTNRRVRHHQQFLIVLLKITLVPFSIQSHKYVEYKFNTVKNKKRTKYRESTAESPGEILQVEWRKHQRASALGNLSHVSLSCDQLLVPCDVSSARCHITCALIWKHSESHDLNQQTLGRSNLIRVPLKLYLVNCSLWHHDWTLTFRRFMTALFSSCDCWQFPMSFCTFFFSFPFISLCFEAVLL